MRIGAMQATLIATVLLSGCYQRNNDMPMAQLPQHPIRVVRDAHHKLIVVAPRCPVVHDEFGHLDLSKNLGCATQYNLAKMIANPSDLLPKNRNYKATASPMISQYQRYKEDVASNKAYKKSNVTDALQNIATTNSIK